MGFCLFVYVCAIYVLRSNPDHITCTLAYTPYTSYFPIIFANFTEFIVCVCVCVRVYVQTCVCVHPSHEIKPYYQWLKRTASQFLYTTFVGGMCMALVSLVLPDPFS